MSNDVRQKDVLMNEGRIFFLSMFKCAPSEKIISEYCRAHQQMPSLQSDEKSKSSIALCIKENADISAIEYALRLLKKPSVLQRKMHILIYLAEATPQFYSYFTNERPQRTQFIIIFPFLLVKNIWSAIKGFYLIRKFSICAT